MSISYYRQCGWEPVLLCVHADDVVSTREPALEQTYPSDIRIIRCRALSLGWSRWLGLGNLGWRAWLPLLAAGSRLLRREPFDLVFFSTTQFLTFALGPVWRGRFGVPYVIDLQDPWRTDYYERPGAPRPPGGRKYFLARTVAFLLEGPVYRRAAGFISVSELYLADLARRYSWFGGKPQAAIRFGVSAADFAWIRDHPVGNTVLPREPGKVQLLYTGASGPILPHAVNHLFAAFKRYETRHPDRAVRFHFHFYGTSYVPPGRGSPSVLPVAEKYGLAARVTEIPYRLGYLESLSLLLQSDALLLLGSSDRAYSPSKLYPYFLSGKPILSVVPHESLLETTLTELNCSIMAPFGTGLPADAADGPIHRFLALALAGFPAAAMPTRNEAAFNQSFLAEPLTRRQCELFAHAAARVGPHR
jgi:glycosyltransferase involved in cell wall biosynthesis